MNVLPGLRRGPWPALLALLVAGCGRQATGPGAPLPWQGPPAFVRAFATAPETIGDFGGVAPGGTNDAWVTQRSPARLWNFDLDGRVLRRIELQPMAREGVTLRPTLVARAPDGSTWIVDDDAGTLLHVAADGRSMATVADGGGRYGSIGDLLGLAVGPGGNVYLLDAAARRVLVYSPEGERLYQFGRRGVRDGAFEEPRSLVVDESGDVYVFDAEFARVLHYQADGTFVDSWERAGYSAPNLSGGPEMTFGPDGLLRFTFRWSGEIRIYSRAGQYQGTLTLRASCESRPSSALGMAPTALPDGGYLALDACRERLHRFDATGQFITWFSGNDGEVPPVTAVARLVVDARGHAFALRSPAHDVMEFDADGRFLRLLDPGASEGLPRFSVSALALDERGNLYRGDGDGGRVLRTPLAGGPTDTLVTRLPDDILTHAVTSVAVDADGRLFVVAASEQVRVFTSAGEFVSAWVPEIPPDLAAEAPPGFYYAPRLREIRLAPDGTLWLLDSEFRRLVHCSPEGRTLGEVRLAWEGVESVRYPGAFALSPDGYLDVVNSLNNKIYRFSETGEYLYRWGTPGTAPGSLCGPGALAWDARGNLYVADSWCPRINVYAY